MRCTYLSIKLTDLMSVCLSLKTAIKMEQLSIIPMIPTTDCKSQKEDR